MPRFVLEPIDLEHRDWKASGHRGRCRVTAPNERAARWFADAAFVIATEVRPYQTTPMSPWKNPERVVAKEQSTSGPPGTANDYPPLIEVPDYSKAGKTMDQWGNLDEIADLDSGAIWEEYPREEYLEQAVQYLREEGHEVDSEGQLNPQNSESDGGGDELQAARWGQSHWGEAKWAGEGQERPLDRSATPPKVATRVVLDEILTRPDEYQFFAQALYRFLGDWERGEVAVPNTNTHPIWGTLENTAELDDLLREIRDELKRFNDLLAQGTKNEPGLAASVEGLGSKIFDILSAVVNSPFGKTVQCGVGVLCVALIYQFGVKLGMPPLDPNVVAVVKHFVPGN